MILLYTDFGIEGPYTGQMKAVLAAEAPATPVVDLMADLPPFDPMGAAYLLAALAPELPAGAVLLGVVDPGVGSARRPVVLRADGRFYVGPDNGLFGLVARRSKSAEAWRIDWRPERLSASFHGRDLFAPVAARLARGEALPGPPIEPQGLDREDWPDDLARVIYVDRYGNAMTGLRADTVTPTATVAVGEHALAHAETFYVVPPGTAFWYENANGLVELSVNQGRAVDALGLRTGDPVEVTEIA